MERILGKGLGTHRHIWILSVFRYTKVQTTLLLREMG